MIGPYGEPPGEEAGLTEAPPLADVPALTIGVNHAPSQEAPAVMRSVDDAAAINEYSQVARKIRKLPAQILPGEVIDVPRARLHVGTGEDGTSTVSVDKGDARLEPRTTLILLPSQTLHAVRREIKALLPNPNPAGPVGEAPGSGLHTEPAAGVEPEDETEICSGTCNVLGSLSSRAGDTSLSIGRLSLAALGYAPHDKQRALSFNDETTLTYLDEHHLLCTFDPHTLRSRSTDGTEPIRRVRAVLIDPASPEVLRVMEWRVRGNESYLWRYGDGQVLVHMEHELRLFDADLKLLKVVRVEGPVPWVVSSPSNDHTAVGVVKRRYSLDEYREMEEAGEKPEEDLEIRVYDRNWSLVSRSLRSVNSPVPVLSDDGELRVTRSSPGHWTISEYGWDRTDHELASVRSICRPLVSAPSHGLTFVTGCMATTGNVWYRMLRADGHPVLKAESGSDEIVRSSEGTPGGFFAIRVIKAAKPVTVDQPFNRADLQKEEIGIYRSSDGRRVSSVLTGDFILAQSSYALSPTGQEMAVAGTDSICFYRLSSHP